jgi:signal transduction histidine kinase
MLSYVCIPLVSSVVCASLATAMLARDVANRANKIAGILLLSSAYWAALEVLWNTADDAETALWLVRASALGWFAVGPLMLHLLVEVTSRPNAVARAALPFLYALAFGFLVLALATPYMHEAVVRTSWGWGYWFGPAYPFFYCLTVGSIGAGLYLGWRGYETGSESIRRQARWTGLAMLLPLAVASLTDGILPLLGFQPPRLGTASLALFGGVIAWHLYRYGFSVIAPGAFAKDVLDTLPDGVALLALDGHVRSANRALAELLDSSPEGVVKRNASSFLPRLPLAPLEEVSGFECELVLGLGRRIPVSVATRVLGDRRGAPAGLVLVLRDLRQMAALRRGLATAARLAAVGELAAGIAHELNNPIAFVRSNLGVLQAHWSRVRVALEAHGGADEVADTLADGAALIAESLHGSERAAAIVRDLRGFAQDRGDALQLADLNQLLEGVLRVAAPALRERAAVTRLFAPLPLVPCNPQAIQQVFLNVVQNASQAIGVYGQIRVRTRPEPDGVLVQIQDDGRGMPTDELERVFDPFFSTRPVGEGMGLGLAIAYQIVRQHEGDISIESAPGRGTTVSIRLPLKRRAGDDPTDE